MNKYKQKLQEAPNPNEISSRQFLEETRSKREAIRKKAWHYAHQFMQGTIGNAAREGGYFMVMFGYVFDEAYKNQDFNVAIPTKILHGWQNIGKHLLKRDKNSIIKEM